MGTGIRENRDRMRRAVFLAMCAAVGCIALLHVLYFLPRTVDDLFISLRYARNLVLGHGLVYNPGERVEGFSSPLWVLLQAIGLGFGFEGVTWTKVLGIAGLGALLGGTYRLARRRLGVEPGRALAACLLLALNPFLVSWSVLGLETPVFLALLVWMVACLDDVLRVASRRRCIALGVVTLALLLCRPEAPLFAAAGWAGALFGPPRWIDAWSKARRLAPVGLAVAGGAAVCLAARLAYYGDWLPHTFHSKTDKPMGWSVLDYVFSRGVSMPETIFLAGGLALAVVLAALRRDLCLAFLMAATVVFASAVSEDWMPNSRFLLPLYVLAPVVWIWAVDALLGLGRHRWAGVALALCASAVLAAAHVGLARLDGRSSSRDLFHFQDRWNRHKSGQLVADTVDCLARRQPEHVQSALVHEMGMIMQVFWILEASDRELEESWYAGRDIGKVGYYTDVRVFDTDGLFTRDVVEDPTWKEHHVPSPELMVKLLERGPVATELFAEWSYLLAYLPPLIRGWTIERGTVRDPVDVRPPGQRRPSTGRIRERYDALVERMPRLYYMQSLYGEAVGANVEKRARFIRRLAERGGAVAPDEVPDGLAGGGAFFGNRVVLMHGCSVDPVQTPPGGDVFLECYFEKLGNPYYKYWIFVHVEGNGLRFTADHLPLNGFVPLREWNHGEVMRDVAHLTLPAWLPPGRYHLFLGFFLNDVRVNAGPDSLTDGQNRVVGPWLEVMERSDQ